MAKDPICGMQVDETGRLSAERDGQTYHFCCEACRRKFLGLPALPAPAATHPFFCPMCAGVESDTPGTCPKCGMALESNALGAPEDTTELDDMSRRFWAALVLWLPVFILSMGPMAIPSLHHWIPPVLSHWIQLCLATPVMAWCGLPFFQRAWQSLVTRNFNMFTLIGLGTGTAYTASLLAMLAPGVFPTSFRVHGGLPVYFESAATIILLVLLGQVLELRARRKTGAAIRELLKLAPVTACILRAGAEQEVPLDQVVEGDTLRVRPGGKVPVDGEIIDGHGVLDQSLITGESEPVDARAGASVVAGTLNLSGSFLMTARRIGSETLFARLVQLVAAAQRSRAPVQHLADRVASVFVPAVGGVALLTFAGWAWLGPEPRLAYALVNAVSVLIVACPCALGLATPMAIMVGIGRGARAGVLVRDAAVLETLHRVDTIVIDKTGTLTEGQLEVRAIHPIRSRQSGLMTEAEILHLAASVEIQSEHPAGKAIVREALRRGVAVTPAENFESHAGAGVSGRVGGHPVFVGKQEGRLTVVVDEKPVATLSLADRIRDTSATAVHTLESLGLKVIMLTGDHPAAAEPVARALGIGECHAGITPAGKQAFIQSLKAAGRRTAMAGDGINDAPALALADVGIAMGTGTDVAMENAGVVLAGGDIRGLARAIRLSRGVTRNIRENLAWAFAYNVAGVSIAAGLLYPAFGLLMNPMIAALAMSFSSVSVVANALRLNRITL